MEDYENAVFFPSDEQVFCKQFLSDIEADEINNYIIKNTDNIWYDNSKGIASGYRSFVDVLLNQEICGINMINRLNVTLKDYYSDIMISPDARFYVHEIGEVRPHFDGNRDGLSNYTLLIYLTDDFEGGNLSIKQALSLEEKKLNADMNFKIFTFTPRKGYGIVFSKKLLHWASAVIDKSKNFMLVHFYSQF